MYIWVIYYEGMDDVQCTSELKTAVNFMRRFVAECVSDVATRGTLLEQLEADYKEVLETKGTYIDCGEYCCAALHKVY